MMTMKRYLINIAAVLVLAGCGKQPVGVVAKTGVVASVGSREITVGEVVAEAGRRAAAGQPVPDKAALLDEMVGEEVQVQRAMALRLHEDPEVARAMRGALIGALRTKELEPKLAAAEVAPEEVQSQYELMRETLKRPERARVGMIFGAIPVRAPAAAGEEVRARMKVAAAAAAGGGEAFRAAAAAHSDHQASRYRGGEIGWINRGAPPRWLPAVVAEAAFGLEAGKVSEPIEVEGGIYVLTLLEREEASVTPLAEAEAGIRTRLTAGRREELRAAFQQELRAVAGVRLFTEALEGAAWPAAAGNPEPPELPGTASN